MLERHFLWQARHLVMFECPLSQQAQNLVMLECHVSWQVQDLVMLQCHFTRQAQHLVMLERHFSSHARHLLKFGWIAGAPYVASSNAKCASEAQKITTANGWVRDDHFMFASFSDRFRILRHCNDPSCHLRRKSYSVAGAILDRHFSWQTRHLNVAVSLFVARVAMVMLERGFSWQAQLLVMSECHFSWQVHHVVKLW